MSRRLDLESIDDVLLGEELSKELRELDTELALQGTESELPGLESLNDVSEEIAKTLPPGGQTAAIGEAPGRGNQIS